MGFCTKPPRLTLILKLAVEASSDLRQLKHCMAAVQKLQVGKAQLSVFQQKPLHLISALDQERYQEATNHGVMHDKVPNTDPFNFRFDIDPI